MPANKRTVQRIAFVPVDGATNYENCDMYFHAATAAAATVIAAGYFNDLRATLKVNDVIFAMTVHGGVGDLVILKVLTVPATGDITTAVNGEAVGT